MPGGNFSCLGLQVPAGTPRAAGKHACCGRGLHPGAAEHTARATRQGQPGVLQRATGAGSRGSIGDVIVGFSRITRRPSQLQMQRQGCDRQSRSSSHSAHARGKRGCRSSKEGLHDQREIPGPRGMSSMQRTAGRHLTRRSHVPTLGQPPDPGPVQRRRACRRRHLSPGLPAGPAERTTARPPEPGDGAGQPASLRPAEDLHAGASRAAAGDAAGAPSGMATDGHRGGEPVRHAMRLHATQPRALR